MPSYFSGLTAKTHQILVATIRKPICCKSMLGFMELLSFHSFALFCLRISWLCPDLCRTYWLDSPKYFTGILQLSKCKQGSLLSGPPTTHSLFRTLTLFTIECRRQLLMWQWTSGVYYGKEALRGFCNLEMPVWQCSTAFWIHFGNVGYCGGLHLEISSMV